MAQLIESVDVGHTTLKVKFLKTIKVASLVNANFRLHNNSLATPADVVNPFGAITVSEDYNSISRTLTLYLSSSLAASTEYEFWVQGLLDATGTLYGDDTDTGSPAGVQHGAEFTTPVSTTPTATDPLPPTPVPVEIEDHSVKASVFISGDSLVAPNPEFYVVSTDPEAGIVDTDHENGRVTIKFSARPQSSFVVPTPNPYFKTQRKSMSRGFTRWETVAATVTADLVKPWVYVQFPPIEAATPSEWFEEGYKYRVRVSKDVAAAASTESTSQGVLNLVIQKGTDFSRTLTWLEADGVTPKNLAGFTGAMQIRASYGGALALPELTTANGGLVIVPEAGRITIALSDTQTSALTITSGVYDLELTSTEAATPITTRLVEGTVTVTPEVTT